MELLQKVSSKKAFSQFYKKPSRYREGFFMGISECYRGDREDPFRVLIGRNNNDTITYFR